MKNATYDESDHKGNVSFVLTQPTHATSSHGYTVPLLPQLQKERFQVEEEPSSF